MNIYLTSLLRDEVSDAYFYRERTHSIYREHLLWNEASSAYSIENAFYLQRKYSMQ
jgi:hypothetical protein